MSSSCRSILVWLGVAVLSACGDAASDFAASADDVPEEQRYGGTLVVANYGDIPDLNPLTSTEHNADQIQMYVLFTPLITYNENFEPVPFLAESWEVNEDTSALTFHLRDDVYWHDGVKTTAYDLEFSYDLATHPETGYPNSAFWTYYGDATAVDSFTFRVEMQPHAEYMDPWRTFTPVPKHVLEGVPPAELRNHPFSTTNPLGNGPFRFVGRQPGQSWTFAANEDYPEELGGRPYVDRLVYRNIPEQTTLLTELLTGGVDYYINPSPAQAARIEASDNARLISFPDRAFVIIGWNERRPMFEDVRVRRALTMAINRQAIVDGVLYGYGSVANSTVPPFFWQYDEEAGSGVRYDPEEARRLLAEAGWEDRNGDGILENEQGTPFSFEIITNQGNQQRADIIEVVQADLRQVGVDVRPRIMEWGAFLGRLNDTERRDFDAFLIGWVTEFRIDDSNLFHCDKLDEAYQWVGYCDPRADQLMDTLPRIMDREDSRALWQEYQRKIAHDQPYTFIYFQERLEGVNNRLRNVAPDARGDWVGVSDWWILPSMRRRAEGASQ